MKYYKVVQIMLQTAIILFILVNLFMGEDHFDQVIDHWFWVYPCLGAAQVIDSLVTSANISRYRWLQDRNWHFIYCGGILLLFLLGLVQLALLMVPLVLLLITSPIVALVIYAITVAETIVGFRLEKWQKDESEETLEHWI